MTEPAKPIEQKLSPWLVLSVLCLGFFMILLDTTIVNIAIPAISDHLHASLSQILWILNAYVLVYAVLLITAGRLGDLYGPKQLFLVGLVIFTLASVACGFAQNRTQLIIFRVVQGLGGALLSPQTLSVLTVIFPADKRGAAFGIWGATAGIATVAGPVVGGWLVTDFGWRWIFFVNVPVGIVALVGAAIVMPNLKLNRRHRLDWVGTLLATVGLFLITFGLIEGQTHDWGKVCGKWLLFVGLSLFSLGMGILIASAHLGTTRWHLLPGLAVAGVGMGMTFAPLQTVAMRNVQPRMAGAASGFINTTRQLGGVIGGAAVGALLQAQLVAKLDAAAVKESTVLPDPQRSTFLAKFHDATTGNIDIGNTAGGFKFPDGTPEQIKQLSATVFGEAFVNAMRVTLWLPIVVLGIGALSVLLVRPQAKNSAAQPEDTEAPPVTVGT